MFLFPSREVALTLGPISVHWYGIMYALGFLIGVFLLKRLQHWRSLSLSEKQQESLVFLIFIGVVLGGRLGFVLFYGGSEYWSHPLEIFAVWNGGMASHGGFIGVSLALVYFCHRYRVKLLALTDVLVVPIAIGLALGRVGNLINGELYGTVTTLPWGMHFPGVEGARHPTQIYAFCKDMLLTLACYLLLRRRPALRDGTVTAVFLMLYGVLRFIVEIFREQPYGYVASFGVSLSWGQVLTIPVFVAGVAVMAFAHRKLSE